LNVTTNGSMRRPVVGREQTDLLERLRRNAPTAPGVFAMQPRTSWSRRSRLKMATSSRCFQRPSRASRLATFVLPATAPIPGCASAETSAPTVSRSKRVAASTLTMTSCRAAAPCGDSCCGQPELEQIEAAGVVARCASGVREPDPPIAMTIRGGRRHRGPPAAKIAVP
jgi:hypothetical protein